MRARAFIMMCGCARDDVRIASRTSNLYQVYDDDNDDNDHRNNNDDDFPIEITQDVNVYWFEQVDGER